ncbi:pyruvate formate-lyase-activating protein [Streptomyces violaceolatus]|uniref:Pyruvate formate-lyase-activating enzyme n=1 Tax=Streptomyces violaceolatus TaxID=67378 RepID=A0ABN3SQD1_9ACTN|nr:pyruvate formate-lyase-activating protein [Streptomyces anthocyanicus]
MLPTTAPGTVTGRIPSWDLSTGVDGPGTRFVLFTSGCPLHCLYCANPDTWHMRDGREATVDEVMAEIDKYRLFSHHRRRGRDPHRRRAPAPAGVHRGVLRRCKEAALHTALDTSGFLGARASDALLADTDLVLLDVKSFDVPMYRKLTGGALAPTVNFATRLDRLGRRVWIRYVLVPGWTDDEDAVDGLAAFLSGLACVERVDILPFHKLGAAKYDALGVPFPLRDTPVPDRTLVDRVRVRFREHGLMAH